MYYLLYCLVYLTYSAVWRSVLSTFYTYYLSIHLALKETCMYLVKLVLFVPLFFFDPCVKQVIFSYSHCMYCMSCTHKLSHTQFFVCLQSSIVAKQCLLQSSYTISFNFFVSIFCVQKVSLFTPPSHSTLYYYYYILMICK